MVVLLVFKYRSSVVGGSIAGAVCCCCCGHCGCSAVAVLVAVAAIGVRCC